MSFFINPPNSPPRMWSSVVEPFDQERHTEFYEDLRSYRVAGRRVYGTRLYRKDPQKTAPGFMVIYEVDLPTIVEKPRKPKKKIPSARPPWNSGTRGSKHIYL